jgi:hypothetical protein
MRPTKRRRAFQAHHGNKIWTDRHASLLRRSGRCELSEVYMVYTLSWYTTAQECGESALRETELLCWENYSRQGKARKSQSIIDWDFGAVSGNILKVSKAVSKVYTVYILSWCTTPWFRNAVHQHLGMERADMFGVSRTRKWK